jgi:hypothetical protein
LDEGVFRRTAGDDPVLFVCVEGAPLEACRTTPEPDGGLTFTTTLFGRVRDVERGAIALQTRSGVVILRHLLPTALELGDLVGCTMLASVRQRYARSGRATIDAELRDAAGRLVLWAHDGRMPSDRDAQGLSVRGVVSDGEPRLAVGGSEGLVSVPSPGLAALDHDGQRFAVLVVRLGVDDAAFAVLRR